jgi:hypothetical protein
MMGKPVIAGTRITVELILEKLRILPSQAGKVISIGDEIKVIGIRTAVSL